VLAELAAAEVCAWVGIPTPAVGLVRFPEKPDALAIERGLPHLAAHERTEVVELYKLNRGALAFCGRLLEGAVDVMPGTFGARARKAEVGGVGSAILFLDAYIRNDDRQIENPNMLWLYDRLVAIDHGHAFSRLSAPGATGAGLAGRTVLHSQSGFERHILRKPLQKLPGAASRIGATARILRQVASRDIEGLLARWPSELDASRVGGPAGMRGQLVEYLLQRREHAPEIAKNLAPFVEET
jgi:hypothetical protein